MNIKNKIQLILLSAFFLIPVTFDTNLLNHNTLHNLIFSSLLLLLSIILIFVSKNLINVNYKFFVISVLFLAVMLISSLYNNKIELFFPDFFKYFSFLIFAFLISHSIIENNLENISIVILTTGLIVSIIGILQLYDINSQRNINNSRSAKKKVG